jgi:hypothetical protein
MERDAVQHVGSILGISGRKVLHPQIAARRPVRRGRSSLGGGLFVLNVDIALDPLQTDRI